MPPTTPYYPSVGIQHFFPDLSKSKAKILTFPSQNPTETAARLGQQQLREGDANHHTRDCKQSTQQGLNTIKGPEKTWREEIL